MKFDIFDICQFIRKVCLWIGSGILWFIFLCMFATLYMHGFNHKILMICIMIFFIIYCVQRFHSQFSAISLMIWSIYMCTYHSSSSYDNVIQKFATEYFIFIDYPTGGNCVFLSILSAILCVLGTWEWEKHWKLFFKR